MPRLTQRQLIKVIAQTNMKIKSLQTDISKQQKEMLTLIISRNHNEIELDHINHRLHRENNTFYDYELPTKPEKPPGYYQDHDYQVYHEPPHSNS